MIFRIDRCKGACGLVFVNPRPSRELVRQYYVEQRRDRTPEQALTMEREYPNSTVDAQRMITTLKRLNGGAGSLLDVGCGFGFFTREALAQGFNVTALELNQTARECTTALTGLGPLSVPFEEMVPERGQFQCILMSQILEHVFDVNDWVTRAARLLVPGGVLAVAVPNFDSFLRRAFGTNDPYITPPEHLNFFTRHSLSWLMASQGLKVLAADDVTRFPKDAIARRVGLRGRAGRGLTWVTGRCGGMLGDIANSLSMGMFLNVYGQKREDGG